MTLQRALYVAAMLARVGADVLFLQPDPAPLAPWNATAVRTSPAVVHRRTCIRGAAAGVRGAEAGSLIQLINGTLDNLFNNIRSLEDPADIDEQLRKNAQYAQAGPFQRAMPERLAALIATLMVEIPVALIISSGSRDLRNLIGSERYALLMAFLPLTSAISGNVGLQASTLTTRAISHGDCTRDNYLSWLQVEMLAACILSFFMGFVTGALAGIWTWAVLEDGTDPGFALTVALAQTASIVIAGLTGTCSPLVFSFIFHRDSGKWAGPMETAIQDIAGSFAMVYMAQALLLQFIRWGLSPPPKPVAA